MAQTYFRAKQTPAVLVFSASGQLRLIVAGRRLGLTVVQRLPARLVRRLHDPAPRSGSSP